MGKSAILAIKIIGDATSSIAAMDKAQRASMSFKDKLGKVAGGAKIAFAAIAAGAAVCAKSAADLEQSVGGVETVFGKSSKKMLDWSKQAAQSAGLSQNSYNEMATVIGSQLQNMGMAQSQAANKTNDLIGLGADLSSMFGGTTSDAVDALSSALKGEMDPIEKYGVTLNDATLKAQAASMGLGDLYASGDRNAKMQATLAAITKQSGKSVGNFGKEADTAQGQQARMNAEFENAKAKLGEGLLPILTKGAQVLGSFANFVQQNTSWLGPLAAGLGIAAAAVWLLNIAMNANPIMLLVTAIAAVIAALVVFFTQTKQGKAAWAAFTGWLTDTWNGLVGWFKWVGSSITGFFSSAGQAIQDKWNGVVGWFQSIPGKIAGFFKGIGDMISAPFKAAFGGIRKFWNSTVGGKGFDIPSWVPAVGGKSFRIPMLANGGTLRTAGTVLVGEAGPEFLNLPAGASVTPLSRTGNSDKRIVIERLEVNANGNLDNDAVAGNIVKALNQWMSVRGKELLA